MLKTKSITTLLNTELNKLGALCETKYSFSIYTESHYLSGYIPYANPEIQGILKKVSSIVCPVAGINKVKINYLLELIVPAPKGTNGHVLEVTQLYDDFINKINNQCINMDGGNLVLVLDSAVAPMGLDQIPGMGDMIKLTSNITAEWSKEVETSTDEIKEGQIEIKLINRTPYHNRKIDMNEEDQVVLKLNTTVVGWTHNETSAVIKLKLPATFVAEYCYIQVTEFNGKVTRWFVLSKQFDEPSVWTLTLKRDVIRDNWEPINKAESIIENGYVNKSSPLYYKKENITADITIGKRSKLIDSNLILAYVKTFNIANNLGSNIPEGYWKVQGGMPGFNNAPIITDQIPQKISLFDGNNDLSRNGYLNILLYWYKYSLTGATWWGWGDNNGLRTSGPNDPNFYFRDPDGAAGTDGTSNPKSNVVERIQKSVFGFAEFINFKQNLNIQNIPSWMKKTGGFGDDNKNVFPENYECVVNKGTADTPRYYKLIFNRHQKIVNQSVTYADKDKFLEYTSSGWQYYGSLASPSDIAAKGHIIINEYTIQEQFLSDAPPSSEAVYTNFPATSIQTTAGAYSYNIFAFKVFDNGIGFNEAYIAQGNSGQMIVSALMGTGLGIPEDIPSLAGQVIDIQMCPYCENDIRNIIDTVYPIYGGSNTTTKVGEYYLLNSQDIESYVSYDLSNWQSHGNAKSRITLSEMRLVCPNNSSVSVLEPDKMVMEDKIQFKINGTLYPYKPVYKVTPIATSNIIYNNQNARDNMLILGGDFSATQVSNAWSDFLIGNKNIEEIQKASTENQVINQQMQYDFQLKSIQAQGKMQSISALLGTAGGIFGLGMGNSMLGLLGIGSGIAGILNGQTNIDLQKEGLNVSQGIFSNNVSLNQKLFNLNIGNTRAMPNTIRKITNGCFDNDYSIIIEEYYSTNLAYEQFDKAIKRSGMTLGCIGELKDFVNPSYFIYAQMIKCELLSSKVFEEINKELQMGINVVSENVT